MGGCKYSILQRCGGGCAMLAYAKKNIAVCFGGIIFKIKCIKEQRAC